MSLSTLDRRASQRFSSLTNVLDAPFLSRSGQFHPATASILCSLLCEHYSVGPLNMVSRSAIVVCSFLSLVLASPLATNSGLSERQSPGLRIACPPNSHESSATFGLDPKTYQGTSFTVAACCPSLSGNILLGPQGMVNGRFRCSDGKGVVDPGQGKCLNGFSECQGDHSFACCSKSQHW